MNNVGEVIEISEITKDCRVFNVRETLSLLQQEITIWRSWGSNNLKCDSLTKGKCLRFTVQGHHHKGYVYIVLNGLDLYDVYLTSNRGTIKTIGKDLYFDVLVEWIDEKVERIPEYTY